MLASPCLANELSLDVKYIEEDGQKFILTKGFQEIAASEKQSFYHLEDPKNIANMSRYVLRAENLSDDTFQFKLCFLFFCRKPEMKIYTSANFQKSWEILKGGFAGSRGKYWVEKHEEGKSLVRFESKVNYSKTSLPAWAVKWGMESASENFMESMKKYIESKPQKM
jgi:hypothetical protein